MVGVSVAYWILVIVIGSGVLVVLEFGCND